MTELSREQLARALAERRRQWESFNAWEAASPAKADLLASIEDRMAWYSAAHEFAVRYGDLAAASEAHRRDLIEWVRISRKAWRNLNVSKLTTPDAHDGGRGGARPACQRRSPE